MGLVLITRRSRALFAFAPAFLILACTNAVTDLDESDAEIEGRWNYKASTQDKLTATFCSIDGIVAIEQYGDVLEGRLTAFASCTARGFAFGEALNEQIIDGGVSGRSVRFGLTPSNCTHDGSVRTDDGRVVRGNLVGNCNHTGTFTMTRQ